MKKYVYVLLVLLFPFSSLFAGSATISLSPSSIASSHSASLALSGSEVYGYNMFIPCVNGIKVYIGGALVSCGSTFSISSASVDSVSITLVNTSGSTKQVLFRVTPRDSLGVEQTDLAQNVYLSVQTVPYPITSFTTNSVGNVVSTTTTLSWTSLNEVDGTNILFSCVDGLTIYSGANILPCGTPAFSTLQSKSSSATFSFVYKNKYDTTLSVKVFPGNSDGTYDLTHSQSIELTLTPPPLVTPTIKSFSAPSTVISGDPLTFSWKSGDTRGINIKMLCTDGVNLSLSTTTPPVSCNNYISPTSFESSSSTVVFLKHDQVYPLDVRFVLVMEIATSTYDGVNTKTAVVTVLPKGTTVPTKTNETQTTTKSTTESSVSTVTNTSKYVFKKLLRVGSRGADVTALQQMLAKDTSIYPEGLVTGYFGTGTRKAVERLQIKYGVTTVGGPGYGRVGPATRALLNSL